ncbi:hypothetical protein M231_03737 [Tremella mesenterica]|uniref:Mediator of RNA polymerase II transcription subunit 16 n=1 Tax=Tremella mesenterica TaxID=5217 RepID=A0A4V1M437_TREME|nr:hypothetical protein M231_03737 [Tremella mesenterica]
MFKAHHDAVRTDIQQVRMLNSSSSSSHHLHIPLGSIGICPSAAVHPQSSQLVYPLQPHNTLYTTQLESSMPPRPLATSPLLGPSQDVSFSPCGRWIIIFHPTTSSSSSSLGKETQGGTLTIYHSLILSPAVRPGSIAPHASFHLPHRPLVAVHLYPKRLNTPIGRAPPLGPSPSGGYDEKKGPTLLVLLPTGVYLIYYQPQADPLAASQGIDVAWGMHLLKCPIHMRYYSLTGDRQPPEMGWKIRRGWMEMVRGSEGVWVGWEREGKAGVTKIDVGQDEFGRYFLRSTPLPPLPRLKPPPLEHSVPTDRVKTYLQGITFLGLSSADNHSGEALSPSRPLERVGAALVFADAVNCSMEYRTRIEVLEFNQSLIELSEGFEDLEPNSQPITAIDWKTSAQPINTAILPQSYSLLALHPLPSVESGTTSLALLDTPHGPILSHIDLLPDSDESWSLRGDPTHVEGPLPNDVDLVISQSVHRGCPGIVGLVSRENGLMLHPSPRLRPEADKAEEVAMGVKLAMEEGYSCADCVRVGFATTSKAEHETFGLAVLRSCAKDLANPLHLLWIQLAIFKAMNDDRRFLARGMIDLVTSASQIDAARKQDGSYERLSIFPLLDAASHVSLCLASLLREIVEASGTLGWTQDPETLLEFPRLVFLLHPSLRASILSAIAALHRFLAWVIALNQPIPSPEAGKVFGGVFGGGTEVESSMDATYVAKEKARAVCDDSGLDLELWGKALARLHVSKLEIPKSSLLTSLISLSPNPILSHLPTVLHNLPTPSSLLLAPSPNWNSTDGVIFSPLPSNHRTPSYPISSYIRSSAIQSHTPSLPFRHPAYEPFSHSDPLKPSNIPYTFNSNGFDLAPLPRITDPMDIDLSIGFVPSSKEFKQTSGNIMMTSSDNTNPSFMTSTSGTMASNDMSNTGMRLNMTSRNNGNDKEQIMKCVRCEIKTAALGKLLFSDGSSWGKWRRDRERGCVCGAAWTRA